MRRKWLAPSGHSRSMPEGISGTFFSGNSGNVGEMTNLHVRADPQEFHSGIIIVTLTLFTVMCGLETQANGVLYCNHNEHNGG